MTLKREYKILTILPLFINYGLCSNIHMPLSLGMETVIVPTFDVKESYDLFNRYKPNIFMCVHDYYEKMLDDSRFDNMDLSFLRFVIYGGAAMDDEKKDKFNNWLEQHGAKGVRLWNGYGMTESCATILTERVPVGGTESKLLRLPDLRIMTVNPDSGEKTKIGEAGELLASGPTIMKGYFNNQEETDKVMLVDGEGTRWLRTGDLAVISEDESVKIIGRLKRMLPVVDTVNGNVAKIYPDNIETVIAKSEYVEKCVVVCLPEDKRVNIPMAFIKLKKGADKEAALKDIKGKCMELNNYSRPYHFFFEDEIRFNKSEKVDFLYYESRLSNEILELFDEEQYQ